jgi:hypothetical protein
LHANNKPRQQVACDQTIAISLPNKTGQHNQDLAVISGSTPLPKTNNKAKDKKGGEKDQRKNNK